VFLKLGARSHLVISIVSVALLIDQAADGTLADIRITIGASSAVPMRLAALEAELRGERLDMTLLDRVTPTVLSTLTPIDDVRASAAYRRDAALILVRRALARWMDAGLDEAAA
jgi:CO/xanthine dehydrogenase FAD-binding subunit